MKKIHKHAEKSCGACYNNLYAREGETGMETKERTEGRLRRLLEQPGTFLKWMLFAGVIGLAAGGVSTAFYYALNAVTALREANPWLLWLLPLGGRGHCSALPDLRHGEGPGHQLRPGGCAGEPAPAPAHGAPHLRRHGAHPPAGRLLRPGGGHPPDRRLPLLQDRTVDAPGRQGQPYHHHVRHVRRLLRPLRHSADRRHVRHGGDQCGRALLRRHRALRPLRHYRPVGGPALRRAAHRLLPPGGAQPYPRHPSPVHRHGGPLRPAFHPVLPDDARRPPGCTTSTSPTPWRGPLRAGRWSSR